MSVQGGLSSADNATLDALLHFLASPAPWFDVIGVESGVVPASSSTLDLLAVAGNFYDIPSKAEPLAAAVRRLPSADVLLTGGRDERLTSSEAKALGGEPLLLQAHLRTAWGVPPGRMALVTGSRVTNHNLRAMIHHAKQMHSFDAASRPVSLTFYEEGFLVRREAAALHTMLQADEDAKAALAGGVRFRPCGARGFGALAAAHGGRADVALALLLGERDRLRRYSSAQSRAGKRAGASGLSGWSAVRLPEGSLGGPLWAAIADDVSRVAGRHRHGLLEAGRALLGAGAEGMARAAATPRAGAAGAEAAAARGRRLWAAEWAARQNGTEWAQTDM